MIAPARFRSAARPLCENRSEESAAALALGHAIVQSLWIGPRLSSMEWLSIRSFLEHGHEVHLFVYEDVEGVSEGTVVRRG